ncbi:hypothetical protein LTR95_003518 [Oleoguttula sp. CCFEE 5521]
MALIERAFSHTLYTALANMQSRIDFSSSNGTLGDPVLSGIGTSFPNESIDEDLFFPLDGFSAFATPRQYDDPQLGERTGWLPERSTWDPGATSITNIGQPHAYRHVPGQNAGVADLATNYFTPLQARPMRARQHEHQMQNSAAASAPQAIPMQQHQNRWTAGLDGVRTGSVGPSSAAGMSDGYMWSGNTSRLSQSAQSSALTHAMQYPQSARQAPYQTASPSSRLSLQSRAHSNSDPAQRLGLSTQPRLYGNPEKQREQPFGFTEPYIQQYQSAGVTRGWTLSPPRTQGSWSHYAGSESAHSQVLPNVLDTAFSTGLLHSPTSGSERVDPRSVSPLDIRGWTGEAYNPGDRYVDPNQLMAHSAPARPCQLGGPSRPMSVNTSMSNMEAQYVCTSPICKTPNATFRSKADLE